MANLVVTKLGAFLDISQLSIRDGFSAWLDSSQISSASLVCGCVSGTNYKQGSRSMAIAYVVWHFAHTYSTCGVLIKWASLLNLAMTDKQH